MVTEVVLIEPELRLPLSGHHQYTLNGAELLSPLLLHSNLYRTSPSDSHPIYAASKRLVSKIKTTLSRKLN